MDRPTSRSLPSCLQSWTAGLAGVAVVAGVLAPVAASAQTVSPSPSPSASPSAAASPSATPGATTPTSARPVLAAPALLGPVAPADAPQPVLKDVVLAWQAVPGARGYRVQVSQDGDFSDDAVTLDATSTSTRLTLPTGLPHAAYRWRVAALQAAGHGFWSTSGAFTKGWRERVTGLATSGAGELPTFSWQPVAGASEYELQVSTSPEFAVDPTQVQNGFGTTACFTVRTRVTGSNSQATADNDGAGDCDFSSFAPGQQRYWRVRALDHVVEETPDVDTTPVVDSGITYQPLAPKSDELDTSSCPEPGGAAKPSPSASPTAGPTPSASAEPEKAGFSCDPAHTVQKGAWSEVLPVVWQQAPAGQADSGTLAPVAVKAPASPLCTERPSVPGEGRMSDCLDVPTFDWEPRAGAVGYRLYIALDDAYTNIQEIVETPATEWTPTTAWRDTTASQTYYYAVQACTETRCGLVTSTPDSLRKKAPRTELTAPASGSLSGPADVVFRWRPFSSTQRDALSARVAGSPAVAEAYAYRLQVAEAPQDGRPATDADFQSVVEDVVVDGALCRPTPVAAGSTVDPRATVRAVQGCTVTDGAVRHDAGVDEVVHATSTEAYPTGSYVWRVQALDASGHGLGWSAVRTFDRDVTPPTAVVSGGTAVDSPLVARFSEPVRGVSGTTVTVTPATAVGLTVSPDGRSVTIRPARTWTPGQTYTLALGAGITDVAGNALAPVRRSAKVSGLVDDGSKALAYAGAWGARRASNAVGGGFRVSFPAMRRQTAATVTLVGKGVLVTGCVGPTGGMMDVWVDGTKRGRVDTYRSFSGCGVRLSRIALADGVHRVQVRGVGVKRPASKGTAVMLDAINAL